MPNPLCFITIVLYSNSSKDQYSDIQRKKADKVFHDLLRRKNVGIVKSFFMWASVRLFGSSRWRSDNTEDLYEI